MAKARTLILIVYGMVIVALSIAHFTAGSSKHYSYKSTEGKLAAVILCIRNPAYQGTTPKDTEQLFFQCLEDYKSAN